MPTFARDIKIDWPLYTSVTTFVVLDGDILAFSCDAADGNPSTKPPANCLTIEEFLARPFGN